MTFHRRERGQAVPADPSPEEGLSPAELVRVIRFKRAYALCAAMKTDCIGEAARIVDRLTFVAWQHRADPADRRAPNGFEDWLRGRRP